MVTHIDAAKREHAAASAPAQAASAHAATTIANAATAKLGGIDAMDFVRDNRIQVKHGSLFVDPYLVLHPRELAPENEARLRDKLRLTYTVNNPSFYESYDRVAIALNLGQLVPTSLEAKRSKLMEEVKKFNTQVESGVDAELVKHDSDKHHPFAAIVRDTIEKPAKDPIGIETLKNGLAVYLLIREKLTAQGYLNKLSDYVTRAGTPDQVLGDLADKIGINPLQLREVALKGGVGGVGKLLGLDPVYVNDVKKITEYAATQDFGFNIIEHWHLGRQLLGVQAPMEQKIVHGIEARITGKIAEFRGRVRHHYEVPEPIKAEEKRIAEALNLVEPIQRALMHKLGYEICYTPEYLADDIAMYRGIYGLHRKAASDLRDTRATYRVYFSGRGDLKGSMRTLVHEVAHNLWPEQFTPDETKKIDALAASDAKRFAALNRIMDEKFPEFEKFLHAYQAGSDTEKAAIVQTTKAYFSGYGVSIDEGLLPYLRDANDFRFLVKHAVDTLSVEGARYAKSGYDSPHERFREVLSRFAELKQVELKGEPQLMQFLAPGLNQVWENHYIPHLKRVYQKVVAAEQVANEAITKAKNASPVPLREEAVVAPEAAASPKVEQRPTPTKAGADACTAHATPDTRVEASSIELNPQTLAALDALKSMGVHAVR
jgi:hypothetical protein